MPKCHFYFNHHHLYYPHPHHYHHPQRHHHDQPLCPHSCGDVTVMYEGAGGKMEKRVVVVERELEELENRLETTNEGK